MNGMVADAIVSDVGADTFTVQRMPPILNEDDAERNRNNPLITLDEADAIREFSPLIVSVAAQAGRNATVSYRTEELDNVQIQGVTADYADFSTFDAERGRMMSAVEVERGQPVALLGYSLADRLFGEIEPLEKTIKIAGIHFRVVGVSEKKGAFFGDSQDDFAVIPLGAYQRLFGARQSLQLMVKPVSNDRMAEAMDDATVALRVARRLKPSAPEQLRHLHVRHDPGSLSAGHERHLRRARRHRRALARRRRHRHHEHHADGGQRADARDRPAQGARRQAQGHHVAGADRIGHALDVRRAGRHPARVRSRPR